MYLKQDSKSMEGNIESTLGLSLCTPVFLCSSFYICSYL